MATQFIHHSPYISSAQRLPNGNTLITQGSDGRVFEVTADHEIVWEFINPYYNNISPQHTTNMVYRAYRVPYEWVPQLGEQKEVSIEPIDVTKFRVPNASIGEGTGKVTTIADVNPNKTIITGTSAGDDNEAPANFCIVSFDETV